MDRAVSRWVTCSGLMVCAGILAVLVSPAVSLAAACEPSIAKAMAVEGKVDVRHPDETQWQPVKLHDTFCPGDMIRVQERSRADIALSNQPMLRLDQNTTMTLGGIKPTGGSLIELVKGATHFFSRVPRNLEVRTAFVNAGVEGTEGVIRVTDDKAEVTIFEGKVVAANEAGTLNITNGQSIVAEKGKAPSYQIVVKPRDAVQWALYYPPVMDLSPDAAVKEDDPRSLAGRAARSLSVGRVDEANTDIDRALKLDPKNSDALALQSIIAVVQNDKDKALTLAQQAVAADPNSASAKTALSYAQQARFDLNGARKTLEEEVTAHPDNALAWARLAELRASFSELDGALEAAQKAVAINPNISRTQTVLGFAYLLRVDLGEAKAAFNKAIELDQADAMPRLGLGLAKFRDGKVEEGRREMEIAASLDPNNSMIRSYLGKAYFEEKRSDMTEREYANAKELDPKDPTPFFYDALQKQLTNRPVEALKDMEKALELNENRAIYRSKLSLDSDVAARSSALARTYTNLGFQQLALVEGWSSLNIDQASFSAHRFLADSYASLPNHEIARVSELLQSQLLQPLNVTPIQPRLGVSNLFLLANQGAGGASFNEFNTLMVNRDRLTFLGTGFSGEHSTAGGELVAAGIYNKASFSVGYTGFNTDGWRDNANQRDNIGNAFLQVELSPRTSVQAEYRYRKDTRGDTQLRFFRDDILRNLRQTDTSNVGRLGIHHVLAPNSDLLANFMYTYKLRRVTDNPNPIVISTDLQGHDSSFSGEVQHLFRSQYINTVIGAGYFNINSVDNLNTTLDLTFLGLGIVPDLKGFDNDIRHTNLYAYTYIKPVKELVVTIGGSGDFMKADDSATKDKDQFNPKFGAIWYPTPTTTVRAAAFRTLKRTLVTDQTLEPTQIAGFNQFYDELNATSAWTYGGAINQKLPAQLYAGTEYSERHMDVPFTDTTGPSPLVTTINWKEKLSRNYLFWTPHDWVSLSAEYRWNRLDRDAQFALGAKTVETNSVPLGVSFFHPSGLSTAFKGTWVNQQGSFATGADGNTFQDGSSNFWVFDAALSYRLPKRNGIISVGATNLFDRNFQMFDQDLKNSSMQPARMAYWQITLALP